MRLETIKKITDWEEAEKDFKAGLIEIEELEKKRVDLKNQITRQETNEYFSYLLEKMDKGLIKLENSIKRLASSLKVE